MKQKRDKEGKKIPTLRFKLLVTQFPVGTILSSPPGRIHNTMSASNTKLNDAITCTNASHRYDVWYQDVYAKLVSNNIGDNI